MLARDFVHYVRSTRLLDWGALSTPLVSAIDETSTAVSLVNMADTLAEDRVLECEEESMRIVSVGSVLTVERGYRGTQAASHAAGALVLYEPRFSNRSILDAINQALQVLNAYEPEQVATPAGSYTIEDGVYEYEAPSGAVDVVRVEVGNSSGLYRPVYGYRVLSECRPPTVRLMPGSAPIGGDLRMVYLRPYATLTWTSAFDIDERWWPFLADYAAGLLMENEELLRSGLTEQASGTPNRIGAQQAVAKGLQSRALGLLQANKAASRVIIRSDQRIYRR